ncbi:ImmA/IrrE family metallo-endopeptidase [Micromonospora sp. WMMD882]|uniref:ImmA/IrrE family metallo-endopeptidase n=1 Tax=Micromonospora sp. WMMD882 TaxID=3015151 RepID=UPI00248BBAB8|nr:ImmA/IrrE family metallo-endopeptidase [Micromonospora sp. WMMD882]WBB78150.1 ImmA/IrrE family metallo-endopeptidase [Micromonospora sp. WMMD882]
MTGWRAKRRLTRLTSGIRVPATPDSAALCQAVAERLDRPVQLLPLPLPTAAPCGIVLSTPQSHYVAYDNRTSPLHQRHIVAHELGHLLAGHAARPVGATQLARLLMPTLDPDMVTSVLGRVPGFDERAEWEAEVIADLLRKHTGRRPTPTTGRPADPAATTADPSAAAVVDRIRQSLSGPVTDA